MDALDRRRRQVVTVTSTQIATGVSVSFVANNGATITGTITAGRRPAVRRELLAIAVAHRAIRNAAARRDAASHRRIASSSGSRTTCSAWRPRDRASYSSMAVARQTLSRMQAESRRSRSRYPLSHAEISPAMLAARVRVDDTLQIDAVMAGAAQQTRTSPGSSATRSSRSATARRARWRRRRSRGFDVQFADVLDVQ